MPVTLPDAERVLTQRFGYGAFRPWQRRVVEAVIAGHDTLAVLPTGGGKSICFQVPALLREGLTVVLSPLVSLMTDQVDALRRRGIAAVGLHGGLTAGEQADAVGRAVAGEAKLLYAAPERLVAGRTLDALSRSRVSLLAVDEAHCISQWGHEFRPAYRGVAAIRRALGRPQCVALTATATAVVRTDIVRVCDLRAPRILVGGFDRPNLRFEVRRVNTRPRRDAALVVAVQGARGAAVVYAQSRARVERIAVMLRRHGVGAASYHAGQWSDQRRGTQEAFMAGDLRVIVATSAFGMGVDKADVRLVVHDAIPPSLEAYYQEAGRAGRDRKRAACILLYAPSDRRIPEHFARAAVPARGVVERIWAAARAHSDASGELEPIATAARAGVAMAEARGAFAVLERTGVLRLDPGDRETVRVRLLATPERFAILHGARTPERALLDDLRAAGAAYTRATDIAVERLQPGLRVGLEPALQRLAAASVLVWRRPGAGWHLVDGRRPVAAPVDWNSLDAQRAAVGARLTAVVRYAEARRCRRAALLAYFGESLAPGACAGCDRCDG
jgi:ATP-dependent DNA helicase RecQ